MIINVLSWLFNRNETNKKSYFSIEYYPITDRYYPKYKEYYLKTNWMTGIVELLESFLFTYASYGNNEADADKIIEKFKEQQLKENIITINKES